MIGKSIKMSNKDRESGFRKKTGMYVIRQEEPGKQKSPWMNEKEMILLWLGCGGCIWHSF